MSAFLEFGSARVQMPGAREEGSAQAPASLPRAIKPQDVPLVFSWADGACGGRSRPGLAPSFWEITALIGFIGRRRSLFTRHIQGVTVTFTVDAAVRYHDNTLCGGDVRLV